MCVCRVVITCPEKFLMALLQNYNSVSEDGEVPDCWRKTCFHMLPKKLRAMHASDFKPFFFPRAFLTAECSVARTVLLVSLQALGRMLAIYMPAAPGCAEERAKSKPVSLGRGLEVWCSWGGLVTSAGISRCGWRCHPCPMLGPSWVCCGGAGGLGSVKATQSGGSHPCVVNECADAVAAWRATDC